MADGRRMPSSGPDLTAIAPCLHAILHPGRLQYHRPRGGFQTVSWTRRRGDSVLLVCCTSTTAGQESHGIFIFPRNTGFNLTHCTKRDSRHP